jgi:hypothetical protein
VEHVADRIDKRSMLIKNQLTSGTTLNQQAVGQAAAKPTAMAAAATATSGASLLAGQFQVLRGATTGDFLFNGGAPTVGNYAPTAPGAGQQGIASAADALPPAAQSVVNLAGTVLGALGSLVGGGDLGTQTAVRNSENDLINNVTRNLN